MELECDEFWGVVELEDDSWCGAVSLFHVQGLVRVRHPLVATTWFPLNRIIEVRESTKQDCMPAKMKGSK